MSSEGSGPRQAPADEGAAAVARLVGDLRALCDLAEANARLPGSSYHVVVIPDAGGHSCVSCASAEEAAALLRTHAGTDVKVEVIDRHGRRCRITRPPARYLLTHEGKFPLFDTHADGDEIDEAGSLATPGTLVVPAPTAAPAVAGSSSDDEDDDGEGEEGDDEGDEGDDDG